MTAFKLILFTASATALAGCAGVSFSDHKSDNSLEYRSAMPAMRVNVDAECKIASDIISIPGPPRYISVRPGLGKADTGVDFGAGGVITKFSSKTEGQVDDALKILSAARTVMALDGATKPVCTPSTQTYLIDYVDGRPTIDTTKPLLMQSFGVGKP